MNPSLEDDLQAIRARYRAERGQYPPRIIDLARVVAELSTAFAYACSHETVPKEVFASFSHCIVTLASLAAMSLPHKNDKELPDLITQVSDCVSSFTRQSEEQAAARRKDRSL